MRHLNSGLMLAFEPNPSRTPRLPSGTRTPGKSRTLPPSAQRRPPKGSRVVVDLEGSAPPPVARRRSVKPGRPFTMSEVDPLLERRLRSVHLRYLARLRNTCRERTLRRSIASGQQPSGSRPSAVGRCRFKRRLRKCRSELALPTLCRRHDDALPPQSFLHSIDRTGAITANGRNHVRHYTNTRAARIAAVAIVGDAFSRSDRGFGRQLGSRQSPCRRVTGSAQRSSRNARDRRHHSFRKHSDHAVVAVRHRQDTLDRRSPDTRDAAAARQLDLRSPDTRDASGG